MQDKISVIIPAFNASKYIEQCVESVESSSYTNLEVIIVDDGSTDNTGEIIEGLKNRYDNIITTNTGDKGISVTRNTGLSLVSGEYFTFVDADDRIMPDMIEKLWKVMDDTGAMVVGCSYSRWTNEAEWLKLIENNKEESGKNSIEHSVRVFDSQTYLKEQLLKGNSRCWSKLYKKDVIGKVHFDIELSIGEDLVFLTNLISSVDRFAEIQEYKGYAYYQNVNGAMLGTFAPKYMDNIKCWQKVRGIVADLAPETVPGATKNLLIAIMLTVGKLAELPKTKQNEYKVFQNQCHELICREMLDNSGYTLLDVSYKIKCKLYKCAPKLYSWLYHFHKYKK